MYAKANANAKAIVLGAQKAKEFEEAAQDV
jgi:hypothetical protein